MPFVINMPVSRLREGPRIKGTNFHTYSGATEIDMWHDAHVTVFWNTDTGRFEHPSAEIHVYAGGEDMPVDTSDGIHVNLFRVHNRPANILVEWFEKLFGSAPATWYVYATEDYNFETGEWE